MLSAITSNLPLILCTGVVILFGIIAVNFLPSARISARESNLGNMNLRAARIIGRRGAAMRDGEDGMSRIQVDGVEWPVSSNDNTPIHQGEILEITAFDGTTLLAKKLSA